MRSAVRVCLAAPKNSGEKSSEFLIFQYNRYDKTPDLLTVRGYFYFRLKNKELILLYAVKRYKGKHNGNGLNIFLIFRVIAIVFVLSYFKSSCA